jgi:hypothetical protein
MAFIILNKGITVTLIVGKAKQILIDKYRSAFAGKMVSLA